MLAIDITRLSLYCVSVTYLGVEFIYFHFYDNIGILRSVGSIISTKSFFHSIPSDTLSGNLPYF